MKRSLPLFALAASCWLAALPLAQAKLPAPSAEAQAKAAEASAKAAWNGKVEAYKLCLSQDKVAAYYRKKADGAPAAVATTACADPGPFVYHPPAPKPAETAAPAPVPAASAPASAPKS